MVKKSNISDFFKLSKKERLDIIKDFANLTEEEVNSITQGFLEKQTEDLISENVIGSFSLPYSVANNFLINGKDYFVPMVTEEPSVVAAASYGAKLTRDGGGIAAESLNNLMIGQVYFTDLEDSASLKEKILKKRQEIIEFANKQDPTLKKLGGGVKDLKIKLFKGKDINSSLRIHLLVDVKDAMGANIVNSISEKVALFIKKQTGIEATLKVVSNLADKRLVKVRAIVTKKALQKKGKDTGKIIKKILKIHSIAEKDIYRTVTNNKGILNGMGAVALATGNDWRALEAAVHGYAFRKGGKPLVRWEKHKKGLIGEMIVPVTVGTVGGIINSHPLAKISLKILDVSSAQELAMIIASVGLAQNLAALRALASEGITKGHKKVWARNVAEAAEVEESKMDKIVRQMIKENNINVKRAKEIYNQNKK